MFRQLFKNKRAQNTAEYALLIALVVAGIIAMQTYAQRALQARVHDASGTMTNGNMQTMGYSSDVDGLMSKTPQYEPYYSKSDYTVDKNAENYKKLAEGTVAYDANSQRGRTGNEESDFDLNKHALGNTSGFSF
jgi:Flp pilus assembly pilin Flp